MQSKIKFINSNEIDQSKIQLGKAFRMRNNGKYIMGKTMKYDDNRFIVAYKFTKPVRIRLYQSNYENELLYAFGDPFLELTMMIETSDVFKNDSLFANSNSDTGNLLEVSFKIANKFSSKLKEKLKVKPHAKSVDISVTKLIAHVKSIVKNSDKCKLSIDYLSSDAQLYESTDPLETDIDMIDYDMLLNDI